MLLAKPPRALVFLMLIGIFDLVSTAVLYSQGLIEELNPLMRPLLEHSPLAFVLLKGFTLVVAYIALQWYRQTDEKFVVRVSAYGGVAYLTIWAAWVLIAHV